MLAQMHSQMLLVALVLISLINITSVAARPHPDLETSPALEPRWWNWGLPNNSPCFDDGWCQSGYCGRGRCDSKKSDGNAW